MHTCFLRGHRASSLALTGSPDEIVVSHGGIAIQGIRFLSYGSFSVDVSVSARVRMHTYCRDPFSIEEPDCFTSGAGRLVSSWRVF